MLHSSLELVVKALVEEGCTDVASDCAFQTISRLGGFSRIIAAAMDDHLARLEANPRAAPQLDRAERVLRSHTPELRSTLQNLISTVELGLSAPTERRRSGRSRERLVPGTYAEVELISDDLSWKGRVDLLVVEDDGCRIVDFKTGVPSPSHSDQLCIYALLWHLDTVLNPEQTLAKQLSIRYLDHDMTVPPPTKQALADLESTLQKRTEVAATVLADNPPRARPSPDLCRTCSVRHLCEDYWTAITDWPWATQADPFSDVEVLITKRHGPKSWDATILRAWGATSGNALVRTLDESIEFDLNSTVRLLGVVFGFDLDGHHPVAVDLVSATERCDITQGTVL